MNQLEQKPIQEGPKENFNEIEAGRLKERLIEAIKTLPGTIKDMARIYKIALQSLGTPEEEIEARLKEVTDGMITRADEAREKADEVFEGKIAS